MFILNKPFAGGGSDSESSYSSSSSSDERYPAPKIAKQRLPIYMRLGTAQNKHSGSRKVKVRSRRSQVGLRMHAYYVRSAHSFCVYLTIAYQTAQVYMQLKFPK